MIGQLYMYACGYGGCIFGGVGHTLWRRGVGTHLVVGNYARLEKAKDRGTQGLEHMLRSSEVTLPYFSLVASSSKGQVKLWEKRGVREE